jgi:molybdopterin/thiamine biosynthesis adenylyltransferase
MNEIKYDRQNRIEGWDQSKLSYAKVAVVGAGALGNHVCLGLIGLGIGTIKIFDFDTIEAHNLNRQSLFCESDVNQSKAEVLANRLKERNSSLMILGIQEKIDDDNIDDLFRGIQTVIDCVDRIYVRRILSRFCIERNIPLIHGGVSWHGGQVGILTRQTPCINCIYPDSEQEREKQTETSCTHKPEPSVVYISQVISGLMVERVRRVLLPLPIDPPAEIGLLKFQAEISPPFYFELINRRDVCDCVKILKRVAPQILEDEQKIKKQKEKDQKSQDLSELKQIFGI